MADNVRLEEIIEVPRNTTMPPVPNTNDIRQPSRLLMTHLSTASQSTPPINIRDFNFTARAVEHSRIFANNISSTMRGIRPLIQHVGIQPSISLSSFLNIQRTQNPPSTIAPISDNYIINVEDQPTNSANIHDMSIHDNYHHQHHHHHPQTSAADNFLNNIREAANEVVGDNPNSSSNNVSNHSHNNNNNNDSNMEDNSTETVQMNPETHEIHKVLRKYSPFVMILLLKGIYDHRASILNFVVLLVTFNHATNVVKREIAKQHNKSCMSLFVVTCYIVACIVFINVDYEPHIFSPYTQPLNIWELLWSVMITDFVSKLITIICKVFLTCLPLRLLPLQKRGKYYLMVEATSQLYRCIAPIQPWLYYFFEAYQGPEKILGIFFSLLYTVFKRNDLLRHLKLFLSAIRKLLQNVNLGTSPTKEQIIASGGICAICHEEYSMPVRLHCKHIFCETCVLTWLNRECSCPLCRAAITDDPIYRDGHTTHFIQLY